MTSVISSGPSAAAVRTPTGQRLDSILRNADRKERSAGMGLAALTARPSRRAPSLEGGSVVPGNLSMARALAGGSRWSTSGIALFVAIAALAGTACTHSSDLPESAGFGPDPTLPAPDTSLVPVVKVAPARGWPPGIQPVPGAGAVRDRLRDRARPSALAARAAQRRRAGRRDQRARAPAKDGKGIKGWFFKQVSEEGRRRGAERQPHHAAARRRRRRRRRDALGVPRRT